MRISDWSSDVCSSDLARRVLGKNHRQGLADERAITGIGGLCLQRAGTLKDIARLAGTQIGQLQEMTRHLATLFKKPGPIKPRAAQARLSTQGWRRFYPRFFSTKSQFASAQKCSRKFGRELR